MAKITQKSNYSNLEIKISGYHSHQSKDSSILPSSRVGVSDPGAQIPNLTSGVNGICSLGNLGMTITWIPTDPRISNF